MEFLPDLTEEELAFVTQPVNNINDALTDEEFNLLYGFDNNAVDNNNVDNMINKSSYEIKSPFKESKYGTPKQKIETKPVITNYNIAFLDALSKGDFITVKSLFKNINYTYKDHIGNTHLHWLQYYDFPGSLDMVKDLLHMSSPIPKQGEYGLSNEELNKYKNSVLVGAQNSYGHTPIHWNIMYSKNIDKLSLLILYDKTNAINKPDYIGLTPLMTAVKYNNIRTFELLLKNKVNKFAIDINDDDVLTFIVYNKDMQMLEMLLKYTKESELSQYSLHALELAVIIGDINIVKLLSIQYLMPLDTKFSGNSLIHTAVRSNKLDLIDYLVKSGLNINEQNNQGKTPLHIAALKGNLNAVILLLTTYNAQPAVKDFYDRTPFVDSILGGNVTVAQLLLIDKDDLKIIDSEGNNLLAFVGQNEGPMTEYLIEQKINPLSLNNKGRNMLQFACLRSLQLTKFYSTLINVNTVDKDNNSVLHYAVEGGDLDIIDYILTLKPTEIVNNYGNTPLGIALIKGNSVIVNKLLNSGSNINKLSNQQKELLENIGIRYDSPERPKESVYYKV